MQQAPWQNQAQSLQRRLSPMTGDMKLGAASSLSSGGGAGLGMSQNSNLGSSLSGAQGAGGATPWANQAQQLQRHLAGGASGGIGGSSLSLSGTSAPSSIPLPSAGGGISNPYAEGVSVPSLGSTVPGASSPYTSTGNAAGLTPYRQPYGLKPLGVY